jgi:hypothetical protein
MASSLLDMLNQLHDRHVEFVIVGDVAAGPFFVAPIAHPGT